MASIGPPSTGAGVCNRLHRLDDDPKRDAEDRQPVRVGDEDLQPVEAVGHAARARPLAHPVGDIGERQRHGVGQHVAGIGDQRERPRQQPAHRLRHHEAAGQDRGEQDAALVSSARRRHVAVAVAVSPSMMVVIAVMAITVSIMLVTAQSLAGMRKD